MYPSFTGSARPKRQVNLSGRNNNPFTAHSASRTTSVTQTTQNALAQAQQERILRQQEREKPPAATRIQRRWRGYRARRQTAQEFRREWDAREQSDQNHGAAELYSSEEEFFGQLQLLNRFADPSSTSDVQRLHHFSRRYLHLVRSEPLSDSRWTYPRLRLAKMVLKSLQLQPQNQRDSSKSEPAMSPDIVCDLLSLLESLAIDIPAVLASYSSQYYKTLALIADQKHSETQSSLDGLILALLHPIHKSSELSYEGFVTEGLCSSNLSLVISQNMEQLSKGINYDYLANVLDRLLNKSGATNVLLSKSHEQLLWLLSDSILFRETVMSSAPDPKYVRIVSRLISHLAADIITRLDLQQDLKTTGGVVRPLPSFVRSKILSLVSQDNVRGLLTNLDVAGSPHNAISGTSEDATALASYALMLLRVFPRRGDEIRMWLYQGSTSGKSSESRTRIPAIKYFYQAASGTPIFKAVIKDPKAALDLLKPDQTSSESSKTSLRNQQLRIILLFLELYSFPLKIMDDEEFLSGSSEINTGDSFTRQSALPLHQVEPLTRFLKNFTFSIYWNASDLADIDDTDAENSLAAYFGKDHGHSQMKVEKAKGQYEESVAAVTGLSIDYVRRMATGVLRMLYERDSRRKFLPKGHWLMTEYFEMGRFISAVVNEEETRNDIEESYADGGDGLLENADDEEFASNPTLIGTSHTQRILHSQLLRKQQQQTSRRKYLESLTPRLEILQNFPFFIPFDTRVQIFREFVHGDQLKRRKTSDADEWRFVQMNSETGIARHRAKVRRKKVFEDAYEQFFKLGDGIKEPIQIRFVDEFDTVEEGIDGGGVTKEFLTSITAEAFGSNNGTDSLFVENDQHLLFPNPSAIEERKETLRQVFKEGSPDWYENLRDLLQRYEFLGRIIGKCLYEGILVDIHFAPFFLLKWALTGGPNTATRESGYRANINDLRDLDEGLYQGLLQLKNYPGNVEDLSLTFSVDNEIRISPTETKTIHHELQPGGSQIPVTNSNRLFYIAHMARYRLQIQSKPQTDSFLKGLGTIISPSWISMFNQSELQTLVGGTSTEVNIPDLRAHTQYGGIYAIGDDGLEHPSIQIFWKVMQELEDVDKKKVLKFVTSTPRAPLLGFGNLNPKFSIRDSGGDQTRLPSTSTCVNLLKLPIYRDERTLRERLLYSVNSGAGFNLS